MTTVTRGVSKAIGFAACAHRNQRRKYTGESYYLHGIRVMEIVAEYTSDSEVLQAAVLHDVIEDTDISPHDIATVFSRRCALLVSEVTSVSQLDDGSREIRKKFDRNHFARSSPDGANIKLADIADNVSTIVKYDAEFARIYIPEKEALIKVLRHGNALLWHYTDGIISAARKQLENK